MAICKKMKTALAAAASFALCGGAHAKEGVGMAEPWQIGFQTAASPIMEQINKIIDELRAEEGYSMIFDAENQAGVLVAADKNLDLTDKVLARLRAAGPPTAAAARPTGATGTTQRPPAPAAQQPSGVQRPKPR